MRKFLLPLLLASSALLFSACNPFSYLMLWQISSTDRQDNLADRRMTELEDSRAQRMSDNSNYRTAEIEAYNRSRGYNPSPSSISTRPLTTEELRAQMEKQAEERRRSGR